MHEVSKTALEASKTAAGVSKNTIEDLTYVGKSTIGDLTKSAKEAVVKKGLLRVSSSFVLACIHTNNIRFLGRLVHKTTFGWAQGLHEQHVLSPSQYWTAVGHRKRLLLEH